MDSVCEARTACNCVRYERIDISWIFRVFIHVWLVIAASVCLYTFVAYILDRWRVHFTCISNGVLYIYSFYVITSGDKNTVICFMHARSLANAQFSILHMRCSYFEKGLLVYVVAIWNGGEIGICTVVRVKSEWEYSFCGATHEGFLVLQINEYNILYGTKIRL